MARFSLNLFEDRLGARASTGLSLKPINRVLYVKSGMATVATEKNTATLSENSAWFSAKEISVQAGSEGTLILRYELVGLGTPKLELKNEDASTTLLMSSDIELDPAGHYLIRCDRVDLPPGGIAYTHTHQGPGIRCLLEGGFRVETNGQTTDVAPGEAWFETGPDPVLAYAPPDRPGCFSRVMILPQSFKGKSSISYVNADDADKPKLQRYTIFIDEFITL